ncbi:MAG: hypothetical protein MI975_21705 [Cytophagales bacterium]|nr:hypothetical protein [Cytophagales bacterium]
MWIITINKGLWEMGMSRNGYVKTLRGKIEMKSSGSSSTSEVPGARKMDNMLLGKEEE